MSINTSPEALVAIRNSYRAAPLVIALIDALEEARSEIGERFMDEMMADNASANIADLRARLETAKAALREVRDWAAQRCPCENDLPRICPLCGADVQKDRCMAVDVSFPLRIRELIDAALEGKSAS